MKVSLGLLRLRLQRASAPKARASAPSFQVASALRFGIFVD